MGSLLITSLYAAPLGLIAIALSTHVTMLRAKTGISILDGGNIELAERIRRHGNFVENVPFVLLLMLLAELGGTGHMWLHISGALLIIGRILHAPGLKANDPKSPLRIAGGSLTTLAGLIMICNILFTAFSK
jgi:uncharacterized membrane protein YecN with MAPEG domain